MAKIDSVDRRIGEMLLGEHRIPFLEILSVKEVKEQGGYCETCWYTEIYIEVEYLNLHEEKEVEECWLSYEECLRGLLEQDKS